MSEESRDETPLNLRARDFGGLVIRSFVSGLLLGAAARLVMRLVALEAGMSYGFSIGGSLEVVAFGVILGTPVAFLFFVVRPRVPLKRPWAGIACGTLLFIVLAAVPPAAARSALTGTTDTPAATALAFGLLFMTWGVVLELVAARGAGPRAAVRVRR